MTGTIVVYCLMGLALLVGSLVSLSNQPGIRGWRNLAMLSIFVLGIVSLFVAGWMTAMIVWFSCAVASALLYKLYDLVARSKHSSDEEELEDPPHSIFTLLMHSLLVWPLIFLEGFEYLCAELFPAALAPRMEVEAPAEDESSA
ncbi:hypothetical protein C5Y96_12625 [Blastopirellula marina]|uniref:Uncharacterized protein n=1 Tax=Blastopirellula marina TaxID=124 RepID=A0A2S8FGA9_9BACT|nr:MULTISPECIES: hypothetical protein [Pirellulaceae]PQO31187.1 hypothetical protein C5Y96_12625 [Blastopirellula marina]RCS51581.1 hypothetical protein DTL36_12635 [Bremerella cremea]